MYLFKLLYVFVSERSFSQPQHSILGPCSHAKRSQIKHMKNKIHTICDNIWHNWPYIKIAIKSVLQSRRRSLKLARLIGCPTGARDGAREALSVSQTPRYIRISPFYIWQYHHNTKIPQYQDISEYYHFIFDHSITKIKHQSYYYGEGVRVIYYDIKIFGSRNVIC